MLHTTVLVHLGGEDKAALRLLGRRATHVIHAHAHAHV